MRPAPLAAAVLATLLTLSAGAWPGPRHRTARAAQHADPPHLAATQPAGPMRFGKSVGSPTEGRLVGGMRVEEGPYLRVVPAYAQGDVRWGLEPLVQDIDRAARAVRRQYPDAVTSVGHLSRAGGGDIGRHHSHESGRDADIGFFVRNRANHPIYPSTFVAFKSDGSSATMRDAFFDDLRNWALVQALLEPRGQGYRVTHIFVAAPLRARLLTMAERLGVSIDVRRHAAEIMQQPRGVLPHDDHFHVRIGCPLHMSSCIENPAVRIPRAPPAAVAHDPHPHGRQRTAAHAPPAHAAPSQTAAAQAQAQARVQAQAPAQAQAQAQAQPHLPPLPPPGAPVTQATAPALHPPVVTDLDPPAFLGGDDPDGPLTE